MKISQIKQIIKEVIAEAIKREHYEHRLFNRLIKAEEINVGYELSKTEYRIVGTFAISEEIKQELLTNLAVVENHNFPKSKSYGVKVREIFIDRNKMTFISPELMEESKNKKLLFVDYETTSMGSVIYAIIRNNILFTIYFAKNYVQQTKEKLNVDAIINIDTIKKGKVYQ